MKQGSGGSCSLMARHPAMAPPLGIKWKQQGGDSVLGGGQEGTSEDSTSLRTHVGDAAHRSCEANKAGESNGEFSFSHQSAHSSCSTIGFPGCAMSGPVVSCARARPEAPLSLKRLAGTDFKTNQLDDHASDLRDMRCEHVLWSRTMLMFGDQKVRPPYMA